MKDLHVFYQTVIQRFRFLTKFILHQQRDLSYGTFTVNLLKYKTALLIKINMTNTIPKPVTPASEGYGLLWKKLNDALWEEDDGKE